MRGRCRHRLGRPLCAGLVALAAAGPLAAQSIRATVDRTEVGRDEQLALTVTVEGAQSAQPRSAPPQLPPLPDFEVREAGQASQFQVVNGRMSASVSYRYLLLPRSAGSFTIGPVRVEIDGRVLESEPFTVRVVEGAAAPRDERDLLVTATVSDAEPYLGQQVLYTWRFYRRIRIADPRLEPLEFPGFTVEDLGEVREFQTTLGGPEYLVSEIRKALFPQEVGRLTIPGPVLSCGVPVERPGRGRSLFEDVFGRTRTETRILRTEPVEVLVRPLPSPPPGFSGLVGRFDLETGTSKRRLRVGETTTLQVTVSGSGNARLITTPELPPLAGFKLYPEPPTASVEAAGAEIRGSKRTSIALVPQVAGELEIPSLSLTYFDPEAGSYRTAASAPLVLTVAPAEGREDLNLTESVAPDGGKVAVRILADDLLPLHRGLAAVTDQRPGGAAGRAWWAALALPPLAFLGLAVSRRRRQRFARDRGLRRRREALRTARTLLRRLQAPPRDGTAAADACHLASRCLRGFVGDKLDLEGAALTPEETAAHLRRAGVDGELVARTRALLEELEAARYGAAAAGADPARLAAETGELLRRLDREIEGLRR